VRLVYRDYPLPIHPSAGLAAAASRCAASQGKFWEMHARLFATHGVEWAAAPQRDRKVMIEFADALGLDSAAFTRCLDDPATAAAVSEDVALAGQLGVNSTPNFLINGQLIRGALPLETFQRAIERARAP
jgi:protein-disulfide isomerase